MIEHITGCGCSFCARLKSRVQSEADWRLEHEKHLNRRGGEEFDTTPLEHAPEGYPAYWLVCPCGAQLLTTHQPKE